jgi:hypothetical protein
MGLQQAMLLDAGHELAELGRPVARAG